MAIGKTASCVMAAALWTSAAQFPVRHEHLHWPCRGVLTVDEQGVRYAGEKGHVWKWDFADIQQFKLSAEGVDIVTYRDNLWRAGADQEYHFRGKTPALELYRLLAGKLDQRLVAAIAAGEEDEPVYAAPVKLQRTLVGSQGRLEFHADTVVYATASRGESRTWRYSDIESISSSGPFELTITAFERARSDYGDRKRFRFQLKQAIPETKYDQLWQLIETKKGKFQ